MKYGDQDFVERAVAFVDFGICCTGCSLSMEAQSVNNFGLAWAAAGKQESVNNVTTARTFQVLLCGILGPDSDRDGTAHEALVTLVYSRFKKRT